MRILIVDDSKIKTEWIRWILEEESIKYDQITSLNEATRKIINSPDLYDGIILDMQFPTWPNSDIKIRAGEMLLKRLKHKNINLPVLGNSTIEFEESEYPFFKGNLHGYHNPTVLNDFLKSLKDG